MNSILQNDLNDMENILNQAKQQGIGFLNDLENIYYYNINDDKENRLSIIATNKNVACRIDRLETEQTVLYVNNKWDYPEIGWGDYSKGIKAQPIYDTIKIIF